HLGQFGCREEDVLVGHCTEAFRQVMAFECARAGEHYGRARFLLAEEDRQSLAPAEAMRLIYEQLLRRIMFRHYDVFGPKIRLTRPEKAGPAVAAWVRSHLSFYYWLAGGRPATSSWWAAASRASPRRYGSRARARAPRSLSAGRSSAGAPTPSPTR